MTPTQYIELMAPFDPYEPYGKDIPEELYERLSIAWETFTTAQQTFINKALWAKHKRKE